MNRRCPVCHDWQCPGCEVPDGVPEDDDFSDPEPPREATDEEYLRLEHETFDQREPL